MLCLLLLLELCLLVWLLLLELCLLVWLLLLELCLLVWLLLLELCLLVWLLLLLSMRRARARASASARRHGPRCHSCDGGATSTSSGRGGGVRRCTGRTCTARRPHRGCCGGS